MGMVLCRVIILQSCNELNYMRHEIIFLPAFDCTEEDAAAFEVPLIVFLTLEDVAPK